TVDTLFDEDFLKRREVPLFLELCLSDLEFLRKELHGLANRMSEDVTYTDECRLVFVSDYAGIWGAGELTVSKGIESIYSLVRRNTALKLDHYLHAARGVVIYFFKLDRAPVISFHC